jgi:hypothetical protein
MEEKKKLKIIDGNFTPEQARDILVTIINGKINHHVMEGFSSRIKDGEDTTHSDIRIKELQKVKESLLRIIDDARQREMHLQILGTLEIKGFKLP